MQQWQIKNAANIIKDGGVIVYPTEAVYGLGCDPLNPHAVERILDLKKRSMDKGLLLIAAHTRQVMEYIHEPQEENLNVLFSSSETPITWLLKAAANVPYWLTGNHTTIAIRLTRHPIAKAICQQLGHPLISTSANISARHPANRKVLAYKYFYGQVDFIVGGSLGKYHSPSEIRDATSGRTLRIAR